MTVIETKMNINDLSVEEKKAHLREIYTHKSHFQTVFNADKVEINLSSFSALFRDDITRLLVDKKILGKSAPLETLHQFLIPELQAYNFDDGVNKISSFFYETDMAFMKIYYQFIKFLRQEFLPEPFWFQATPTIRIHCPNAENNQHYPRYHSDISYGHPPEEINIWFPLTACLTGHGFRVLSIARSQQMLQRFDYDFAAFIQSAIHDKSFSADCDLLSQAITTEYGNMIAFDSRCIHTGEPLTAHTRVSIDIRILPLSQWQKMTFQYQGSGRRKILFEPGHCYHEKHSDYFLNH